MNSSGIGMAGSLTEILSLPPRVKSLQQKRQKNIFAAWKRSMETLHELIAVLDTCTEAQRHRFPALCA